MSPTVLVTGVSGAVGPALARRLADEFDVRALVRGDAQAARAKVAGWQPVHGDLCEPSTLTAAMAGVDVVVHAAASLGSDWAVSTAVNVDGTRCLAESARDAGAARFIHISTMSAHGEPQPDGLTESSPLAIHDGVFPYVATKARAEAALSALRAQGLAITVLRPGAICSLRSSHWGDRLVHKLARQGWPANRHPDDVIPWVHTDDLADMVLLCATMPAADDDTFLAVDENVTIRDLFGPICDALRVPITPPMRAAVISRCRIGKIRHRLGYSPRHDFRASVADLTDYARLVRRGGETPGTEAPVSPPPLT